MHMVAARLGCESAIVGTRWANSCPGCMDRLKKRYSHLVVVKVNLRSVLESELGQKWRYGVLKASIG